MIETFELVYPIVWLVLALTGAAFALALVWSLYLYAEEKRAEELKEEEGKEDG